MRKLKFVFSIVMVMVFFIMPIHAENMDGGDYVPPGDENTYEYDEMYPECLVNDYECIAAHVEGVGTGTAEDIQQAIRSFDPDIAAQEADKDYLKNFQNSMVTAMTDTLNPVMPHTIIMQISNFLIMILEVIGGMFSLLCLVAYNLVSGSTIEMIISTTLDTVSNTIFNWNDTSSWIYNFLFLFAFISFVRKIMYIMTRQGGMATNKSFFRAAIETIVSICVIVFIGLYGRPTIHYVETLFEDSIVTIFNFNDSSQPMEITMKEQMFDIMQMKPFMMRHFGTTDIERLPLEDAEYEDLQTFNEGRVKKLLTDPSTTSARAEKKMGNTTIIQGIGSAFAGVLSSLLGLIHKIVAGIVILLLILILGVIRVLKEILLFFSIFGLIIMLLQPKNNQAYKWFYNRVLWMLLSTMASVFFSITMFAWNAIINTVIGYGFIFAIIVDCIMLILLYLAWKFKDQIIAKFNEINADGMMSGIFNGTISPATAMDTISSSMGNKKIDNNGDTKDDHDTSDNDSIRYDESLSDTDGDNDIQAEDDFLSEATENDMQEENIHNEDLEEKNEVNTSDTDVDGNSTVENLENEDIDSLNTKEEDKDDLFVNNPELEDDLQSDTNSTESHAREDNLRKDTEEQAAENLKDTIMKDEGNEMRYDTDLNDDEVLENEIDLADYYD